MCAWQEKARRSLFHHQSHRIAWSMLTDFPHEMQYAEHHWEVADSFQACREKVSLRLTGSCRRNYANFLKNKVWKPWRWLVWKDYPHIIGKRRIDSTRIRKKWRMWIEILLKTCTHPSVVGSTEHFLLVGRKQS